MYPWGCCTPGDRTLIARGYIDDTQLSGVVIKKNSKKIPQIESELITRLSLQYNNRQTNKHR